MKKLLFSTIVLLQTMTLMAQDIQLPTPKKDNPVTLMQALQQRRSERTFADKEISDQVLSEVLWAACGINRPESGKITAPSAINAQDILVYVVRKDGTYLYLPKENKLQKKSSKDLRNAIAGNQTFAAKAPVSLLMVSDHKKFGNRGSGAERMGLIDSGYVSQNISLACSALGLSTVPRVGMDSETLRKELELDDTIDLILNQQIGWPEK